MSKTIEDLAAEIRKLRIVTILVAVLAVAALVLAGWSLGKSPVGQSATGEPAKTVTSENPQPEQSEQPEPTQEPIGTPSDAGPVHAGTIVLGASGKDQPVLDVYEDFKCPACAQVHQFMGPQVSLAVSSGEVEVRFHPMSFLDRGEEQGGSWRAAKGAFCADDQGKFMEYYSNIWPNQQTLGEYGWSDEALESLVDQAGLNAKKWSACMADDRFDDAATQANDFALVTVQSTPTFMLNGTTLNLEYVVKAEGLMPIIEANS